MNRGVRGSSEVTRKTSPMPFQTSGDSSQSDGEGVSNSETGHGSGGTGGRNGPSFGGSTWDGKGVGLPPGKLRTVTNYRSAVHSSPLWTSVTIAQCCPIGPSVFRTNSTDCSHRSFQGPLMVGTFFGTEEQREVEELVERQNQ